MRSNLIYSHCYCLYNNCEYVYVVLEKTIIMGVSNEKRCKHKRFDFTYLFTADGGGRLEVHMLAAETDFALTVCAAVLHRISSRIRHYIQ